MIKKKKKRLVSKYPFATPLPQKTFFYKGEKNNFAIQED